MLEAAYGSFRSGKADPFDAGIVNPALESTLPTDSASEPSTDDAPDVALWFDSTFSLLLPVAPLLPSPGDDRGLDWPPDLPVLDRPNPLKKLPFRELSDSAAAPDFGACDVGLPYELGIDPA
jgi:hypothetical protein